MAERKHKKYRRVDSSEIQGEGSYVLFESPGFDALAVVLKVAELEGIESGNVDISKLDEGTFDAVFDLLDRTVKEWNWVDDDGQPLPQPGENDVIRKQLTQEEQVFLISSMPLGEAKN
ncbi:MAG: hypothetical protein UY48_C0001G0040 [Candidatus Gottesmanbacteria bacterium GW2011_GWB1_49_7]|uniref:Uncharacterized protein n=1 Tax=Candidatus Gottesmanbacteria bacterium GW2011_GWB1_49_7 TaxID=1618448 RepID=A0A0G1Z3P7_9BACT|nr:MAG: hypothetical protein UY48_C0001G0040 [Candidatus Gottesmanbacteria bacterium GW2011_GWB1_49_7]